MRQSRSRLTNKRRRDLKNSESIIGQLYPVLRDAKGKVIDGYHRLDADPSWKSEILEDVKTEEDRLIVSLHANLGRRSIGIDEKREIINALAEVYWDQGLRPDFETIIERDDGKKQRICENQISQKLIEVLKGVMGKSTINKLLYPKYKNMKVSTARMISARKRIENTSALKLIQDCFGTHIERSFGKGIFGRLEREMFTKAKESLRNDPWWINKVKDELREEIRAEIMKEMGLETPMLEAVQVND